MGRASDCHAAGDVPDLPRRGSATAGGRERECAHRG